MSELLPLLPEGGKGRGSIWVHCASLGEFEQGRPLIEALREREREKSGAARRPIVVTFFSPSGFQVRRDYDGADAVFYLPADTPRRARRFVAAVRPELAIFVKYEYWYNYLHELDLRGVPAYVVSAIFRPDMVFFRSSASAVGRFMRRTLGLLKHFFVQNEASKRLLEGIGIEAARVSVSGDTRFDRVSTLALGAPRLPLIEAFASSSSSDTATDTATDGTVAGEGAQGSTGEGDTEAAWVMVCGSTWPADEELILSLIRSLQGQSIQFIVAPHEIDSRRIDAFLQRAGRGDGGAVRYTSLLELPEAEGLRAARRASLLVVDTVGLLSGIYRYARVAYIGGGFGRGIHNTLEAATWGIPVLFGPNYTAFAEALELVSLGAALPVGDGSQLMAAVAQLYGDEPGRIVRGDAARAYVQSRAGAADRILAEIF